MTNEDEAASESSGGREGEGPGSIHQDMNRVAPRKLPIRETTLMVITTARAIMGFGMAFGETKRDIVKKETESFSRFGKGKYFWSSRAL